MAEAQAPLTMAEVGFQLRPYQKRFLEDESRLVAVVKARQIGMSEAAALLAVMIALRSKRDVWLLATNLAGAKELLLKALTWVKVLSAMNPDLANLLAAESTERVTLDNGSRITALPCTRAAVRGKTGTVIWDETAHTPDDRGIWTALAPIIASNPNLRMIMISTPNGDQGVFADAVHGRLNSAEEQWSVHRVTVDQAVADGFPAAVLRQRGIYSADAWAQEFLCSFLNVEGRVYGPGLVSSCHADSVRARAEQGPLLRRVLSIDLASKKDSSVALYVEHFEEGGAAIRRPINLSTALHPKTYPQQRSAILRLVEEGPEVDLVVVDAAGPGAGLAQQLSADLGTKLVREHTSTAPWKAEEIPALKAAMESGVVYLENDPALALAFGGVRATRTSANRILYTLARDEHGHSDAFSAALMGYSVFRPRLNARVGKVQSPAVSTTLPPAVLKKRGSDRSIPSFASIFGARRNSQ